MPPENSDRAEALRETLQALFELGTPTGEHVESLLSKVAPEDVASVLSEFHEGEKLLIFNNLADDEARAIVLEETDGHSERDLLAGLSEQQTVAVFEELPTDDLVDHLEYLPEEVEAKVIEALEEKDAKEVEELRKFAPDTAGGIMNTEFISVTDSVNSRQALEKIQGNLNMEVIGYVYVAGANSALCGVASIRRILEAKPETPIADYMTRDALVSVALEEDQEEVVRKFDKYNFMAIPVVDAEGRVKGVVTYDDVIDAAREETSEDMMRLAGTTSVHPFTESVGVGVLKRFPFLVVTMAGGLGILVVVERSRRAIGATIDPQLFSLAVSLIPLLIGVSGNVAIVTSTMFVRGLATGELTRARLWKALFKEVAIGTLLGFVLALCVTATVPALLAFLDASRNAADRSPELGHLRWLPAVALSISVTFAAFLGGLVPLLCRLTRKIDPAIASGPFVTMLCDLSVSAIFLTLLYSFMG